MSSQTPTVELQGVTKQFGETTAVDGIDLTVHEDELLTLLGPSGCGKTTTLRMISGLEETTEGTVRINGADATDQPPYHRDTAMVFQQFALFPHMSIADNIAFGLEMQNVPSDEIGERVADTLEMVRLPDYGDRYPSELSGGQQQRIALARALVLEPSVLLLDEPLASLDKKLREEMQLEILRIGREIDVSMVYVTHNQQEALTISDRMAVMADGEIHQVGTPEEIYREPANEFVADFIGHANLVAGSIASRENGTVDVDILAGDRITVERDVFDPVPAPETDVQLLIRPERLSVVTDGKAQSMQNVLTGTVEEVTYLGSHEHYFVSVGDETFRVVRQNEKGSLDYEIGDEVRVVFDSTGIIPVEAL